VDIAPTMAAERMALRNTTAPFGGMKGRKHIAPRVKLRARPAPSQLNCDTSYIQLVISVLQARQLQRSRYAARPALVFRLLPKQLSGHSLTVRVIVF
jgi:hypothetical protein